MTAFNEDLDFLIASTKGEKKLSLMRALWSLYHSCGLTADETFPLDIADRAEARVALNRYCEEISTRLARLNPAAKWTFETQCVATVRHWLDENPDAARLLDVWRKEYKR